MRKIQNNEKSFQSDFGLDQMFLPNVVQVNENFFYFLTFSCIIKLVMWLNHFIALNEFYSKNN